MKEEIQYSAEGDALLTEEQIDRFIPERIGVRNWGKPEQADLFNRGQVRDAIRTAIASQPNVQPKGTPPLPEELGQWLTAIGELYIAMGRPPFEATEPTLGVVETLREAAKRLHLKSQN